MLSPRNRYFLIPVVLGLCAALGILLSVGCAGRTWDRNVRIAINTTARGVSAVDSIAARTYRQTTDSIAQSDGDLRGPAYVAATAQVDRDYGTVVEVLRVARVSLLSMERALDHYQSARDMPAQCAVQVHMREVLRDVRQLIRVLQTARVDIPPDITRGLDLLERISVSVANGCLTDSSTNHE